MIRPRVVALLEQHTRSEQAEAAAESIAERGPPDKHGVSRSVSAPRKIPHTLSESELDVLALDPEGFEFDMVGRMALRQITIVFGLPRVDNVAHDRDASRQVRENCLKAFGEGRLARGDLVMDRLFGTERTL